MKVIDIIQFPQMQRKVLEQLFTGICDGTFVLNNTLGNELTLAKRLGVSRSTLRSVMTALEDYGIVQQIPHRGIFLRSLFEFGTNRECMAKTSNHYYLRWCDSIMEAEFSQGMERFAKRHSLAIRVLNMHMKIENLLCSIRKAVCGDSVILVPPDRSEVVNALREAIARGVRVIQLDRYLSGLEAPSILVDHYAGAALATRHLLEQQDIPVWFFGYRHPVSAEKRFCGWRDVMLEYGYHDFERYQIPCGNDLGDMESNPYSYFENCFRTFYSAHKAEKLMIFCLTDYLAQNVYQIAKESGRVIGCDLWIAGFGDLPFAERMSPPLTTVHAGNASLCEAAGTMLLNWPGQQEYSQIQAVELIVRGSSLVQL
ncbi:MAG: substrate-binding domain-containing protein [Victivallales bacterium]